MTHPPAVLAEASRLRDLGRTGVTHQPDPADWLPIRCTDCGASTIPFDDCRGSRLHGVYMPYRTDARRVNGTWIEDKDIPSE